MSQDIYIKAGVGEITVTGHPATITVTKLNDAIEANKELPDPVKELAKPILRDQLDTLNEHIQDLSNYPVPPELAEWWDVIVGILKMLAGLL